MPDLFQFKTYWILIPSYECTLIAAESLGKRDSRSGRQIEQNKRIYIFLTRFIPKSKTRM